MRVRAKWIDKVRREVVGGGFFNEGLFFVFDDDFVVVDFDNFVAVDGKFGVHKRFESGAFDDDLVDGEGVAIDDVADDFAEMRAALGFDFEINGVKMEGHDLVDIDDVGAVYEFVFGVDDKAEVAKFADGAGVEDVANFAIAGIGAVDGEGDDLKFFGVDDGGDSASDGGAEMEAEDGTVDNAGDID